MVDIVLRDVLHLARADDLPVRVELRKCIHRCCGGGWAIRNRHDTYTGKVTALERGYVVIVQHPLGRITETLVELSDILSVEVL